MLPSIIKGNNHEDNRGKLKYNNNFNLSGIKRMYAIENANISVKRGWQGYKIEQRWFTVISRKFEIMLLKIDHWECPTVHLQPTIFELNTENLDVLHLPAGYITCIQSKNKHSKLVIMSDFILREIKDEYKFNLYYFNCTKNK